MSAGQHAPVPSLIAWCEQQRDIYERREGQIVDTTDETLESVRHRLSALKRLLAQHGSVEETERRPNSPPRGAQAAVLHNLDWGHRHVEAYPCLVRRTWDGGCL